MITVYFAFPFRGIGGCSVLFLRIAKFINQLKLANCILIDYVDGYMATAETGLPVLNYGKDDIVIPNGAIFVTQSTAPWSIYNDIRFSANSRIFYWNCHPFNLIPTMPGLRQLSTLFMISVVLRYTLLRKYYLLVSSFVDYMNERNSLVFMDGENLAITETYLSLKIKSPKFLPIPVECKSPIWTKSECKEIKILWVGRIVDFKYHILKYAIKSINNLKNHKITVEVVGTGNYLERLIRDCEKFNNIKIRFVNEIDHQKLVAYMSNFDIVLAMGTTALESSSVGIPTILLDPKYNKVDSSYQFRWLYDTSDYDLGSFTYHDRCHKTLIPKAGSIEQLIEQFVTDPVFISKNCYSYVQSNHDINEVAIRFIKYLEKCNSTFDECLEYGFSKPGLFYRILRFLRRN